MHRRTPSYDGPTARVTFKAPRALPFGQVLKLVGSHHELGEWELTDAPGECSQPPFEGQPDDHSLRGRRAAARTAPSPPSVAALA
mgnify:CR=1 FL=1